MTGLTGKGRTKHLRGPMYRGQGAWKNNAALLSDVDRLPTGPDWRTEEVEVGEGSYRRIHTVYFRDILEVVRELIGATRFKDCMRYAPERHWTSQRGGCQVYDEMWSGNWWWRMQHLIRDKKGTIVPLIIASDETTLTNNPKGEKAHPIYLSIGNINKSIRRKPTKRAMVLIRYLPVDSFQRIPDSLRRRYHSELLHRSLEKVFEPLKTASSDGLLAWCADGHLRHIYPIIAAWIADWPEQNDIACTTQGGCPKCMQRWHGRGQGGPAALLHEQDATLEALRTYQRTKRPGVLKPLLLQRVMPFWANIPYVDIGTCMAPDLLHQLYKGMLEHARDWVEELLGTDEFNRRFKSMPRAYDLRHFKKGVTTVKVWKGRESREMMRQFLPVVINTQVPPDFIRMIRALLDISYLAQGAQLTEDELTEMNDALAMFHRTKHTLVDLALVSGYNVFDRIAKLHMVGHYPNDIRELGSPDGYSSETPEYLHIVYAKIPWRMSNRRNPMPQIVGYVKRIEAIEIQRTIIDEFYGERPGAEHEETSLYSDYEDEDESESDEGDTSGDEDSEGEDEDEGETIQIEPESEAPERSEIYYYPRPVRSIAKQPTAPRVPGRVLMASYHASDLIRVLRRFLLPIAQRRGAGDFLILPTDRFNVWHKVTLNHSLLPFAPNLPCHRDVVQAHPAVRDAAGHVKSAGVFDTALFATDPDGVGLNRYRAGRVRAIFTLPPRLEHLFSGPLAYLEIFTPFISDAVSHQFYRTTHAYSDGGRASIVIPLACLAMACHIAPDFSSPSTPAHHFDVSSPAYPGREFVVNDFYNHFTHRLMAYWRHVARHD
ncbi:hypothetical protein FRC10_004600 [Ceratobasidium sp. 414]|nr:hypothetical protein FRC10_004600 [Ceratobasidium sp. 414]